MKILMKILAGLLLVAGIVLATALVLVSRPMPTIDRPPDVFGFGERSRSTETPQASPLLRMTARDGSALAYRFYDSSSEKLFVFAHGSSYHGASYMAMAESIARSGAAKVVLPNLRGHYLSGRRRGDVDYIGQLEDDLADLIALQRRLGHTGPAYVGGHSSGGGLAIRFGSGPHRELAAGLILLAPVIPTAPSVRGGDAGGWAIVNQPRLFGLIALGVMGIHGFDGLPIIQFNKPREYWDGTETLSYTYRLNASYHPRHPFETDLQSLAGDVIVLVGEKDEAIDAEILKSLFSEHAPQAAFTIAQGLSHFEIFSHPSAHELVSTWLLGRP